MSSAQGEYDAKVKAQFDKDIADVHLLYDYDVIVDGKHESEYLYSLFYPLHQ